MTQRYKNLFIHQKIMCKNYTMNQISSNFKSTPIGYLLILHELINKCYDSS